jgi:hypothetical protein
MENTPEQKIDYKSERKVLASTMTQESISPIEKNWALTPFLIWALI